MSKEKTSGPETGSQLFNRVGRFAVVPSSLLRLAPRIGMVPIGLWAYFYEKEDHATGNIFPSYATIQAETGLDDRAIVKAIRILEAVGALERQKRYGESTKYFIQPPSITQIADTVDYRRKGHPIVSPKTRILTPPKTRDYKELKEKNIYKPPSKKRRGGPPPNSPPAQLPLDPEARSALESRIRSINILAAALRDLTKLLARQSEYKIATAATQLFEMGATREEVEQFGEWWRHDWRSGAGKGRVATKLPRPDQVVELWEVAKAETGGRTSSESGGVVTLSRSGYGS